MASKRSYRDVMPQAAVRQEIQRGRGTQFDPEIANIMLAMIDEDPNYRLRGE
jgi:putative two-component system response regulator